MTKVQAADGRRKKSASEMRHTGQDPISFLCAVLRDEDAPDAERRYAAKELFPYYHPELATIGPLLWKFLKPASKA